MFTAWIFAMLSDMLTFRTGVSLFGWKVEMS